MQNFPPHSKAAWLQRALKELPETMRLDDLVVSNDLYVHDGFPGESSPTFNGAIKNDAWQITAEIADLDNATALKALENGAQCLYLTIEQHTDIEKLFQGVRFDYITTLLNLNRCNAVKVKEVKEAINAVYPIQDLSLYMFGLKDICNTIQLSTGDLESIEEITHLVRKIIAIVEHEEENLLIEYQLSADFFKEIAKIRALKILAANVKAAYGKSNKVMLLGRPLPSAIDFNHSLIKWSFEGMAAVLSDVDFLSLHQWSQASLNEARLAQNIQHLFREESALDLYNDAMAGSYFIENVTRQIVDKVWQAVNEV